MKIMNWEAVEESTPFEKLPAGGYVVRIVDVEDIPEKEYLNVVYDVAEGEHAGFYSDDFGVHNPWAHRFVRSYKESAQGMFKAFLKRLEESNPGFTLTQWQQRCNEFELVGLLVGITLQLELYTNDQGEDRERLNVAGVYAVQDIRNGAFKLPEPKDNRKNVDALSGADELVLGESVLSEPGSGFGQDEQPPLSVYRDIPFL